MRVPLIVAGPGVRPRRVKQAGLMRIRVEGLGIRVQGLGFKVLEIGLENYHLGIAPWCSHTLKSIEPCNFQDIVLLDILQGRGLTSGF